MTRKYYGGIDYFRIVAACLVILIHTAPLEFRNPISHVVSTHILARVAVPFFFMTSGFFLMPHPYESAAKLWRFVKKWSVIYSIVTVVYLPLIIYKGYFKQEHLLVSLLKDIVFDGTMYHLWYLPASIIGAVIAWYIVKKGNYQRALILTGLLYSIGLFGDSYYGIGAKWTLVQQLYRQLFQLFDYTRNGFFFAPFFFVLGGFMASKKHLCVKRSLIGLVISLLLLLVEGLLLFYFKVPRHDSMYIFLVPSVFFLFQLLLHWKGKPLKQIKQLSLYMYLVHPLMIALCLPITKFFQMKEWLIQGGLFYYSMICLVSFLCAKGLLFIQSRFIKEVPCLLTSRVYVEINVAHLAHNVHCLKQLLPQKTQLMAVVKANAYGHGSAELAKHLNELGVYAFAVATIDEGIVLRKNGIKGSILILGFTPVCRAKELQQYELMQTIIDYDYAVQLNQQHVKVKVHLKVDTGMHRLGISAKHLTKIIHVFQLNYLIIDGLFTHLCVSDSLTEEDKAFTHQQIQLFDAVKQALQNQGLPLPKCHVQSSYGLLNYPELAYDYARIGIALYGVQSSLKHKTCITLDLKPVLALKTRVILLKMIERGESVGYDRSFIAKKRTRLVILPIGYADGLPRQLSHQAKVLINGQYANVIGRICMDQLMIDVTDITQVSVGSIVTLIGTNHQQTILATQLAEQLDSITNELLSRIGKRLPVIYNKSAND